ncbi:hypothetical protein BKK47_02580 [Rodentibacter mrazii]|uniref:Uncharacterized protein n=1 Tax=Rodentibacter mrazii TaxID=1908257 RepID=A0A1V3IIU5_9PAST|nr:hypothetical protein [Rodentibacter mrazii]OOF40934.1 hypothetical protein BKK47_02580 [Rodentibacter mrazii]
MRVRRLDKNHDWTFGQGFANYASESESIAQNVQTRLWSFANDWFLDLDHGLPWLEQMGRNVNLSDWEIRIKRHVLQTEGVAKITEYESNLDPDTRQLKITIGYQDIYGQEQSAQYESRGK